MKHAKSKDGKRLKQGHKINVAMVVTKVTPDVVTKDAEGKESVTPGTVTAHPAENAGGAVFTFAANHVELADGEEEAEAPEGDDAA